MSFLGAAFLFAGGCADESWRWPFVPVDDTSLELSDLTPDESKSDPEAERLLDDGSAAVLSRFEIEGVSVEVLREGAGLAIKSEDGAVVQYRVTLANGTPIDRTESPRGPWPLRGMVPGLRSGLIGMRVGGVRRVIVPPEHAYGELPVRAPGTSRVLVPGDATVIYTIYLVGVVAGDEPDQ